MRNKDGLTAFERITKDLNFAETETDIEQRTLLAHMAIASAELAIDYNLITFQEWGELIHRAFKMI